jgi:hypothetical protein
MNHGTIQMYTTGKCRCNKCRSANAERERVRRSQTKTKAKGLTTMPQNDLLKEINRRQKKLKQLKIKQRRLLRSASLVERKIQMLATGKAVKAKKVKV